jgi:hyperosmotically inducible periplasmic protein
MVTRLLAAALVMLALAAPARAAGDETLQLFREVQKQVLQYPHFTIFDSVHAEFDDEGVVTLTGKVTMPYKRTDIEKRVARLDGVAEVQNQIEVLPVSQFDDDLRLRIARAIYGNSNFWRYASMVNPPIHIIVERGHVTLEGVVNSNVDRMLARSLATQFGSFSLKNELKTDAEARAELEKL